MLFVVFCTDKPDHLAVRTANRPEHLAYLEALGPQLKLAGPTLDAPDGSPTGSMIVLEAGTLAEAETWAAGDPYAKAGLFASVTVRPWRRALGHGL